MFRVVITLQARALFNRTTRKGVKGAACLVCVHLLSVSVHTHALTGLLHVDSPF